MQQKDNNIPDISQLIQIANSPAGHKLMEILQKNDSEEFRNAMQEAADGDMSQAQRALRSMMERPDIAGLVEQLRRQQNG